MAKDRRVFGFAATVTALALVTAIPGANAWATEQGEYGWSVAGDVDGQALSFIPGLDESWSGIFVSRAGAHVAPTTVTLSTAPPWDYADASPTDFALRVFDCAVPGACKNIEPVPWNFAPGLDPSHMQVTLAAAGSFLIRAQGYYFNGAAPTDLIVDVLITVSGSEPINTAPTVDAGADVQQFPSVTTVTVKAAIMDADAGDRHTATIDWGDGTKGALTVDGLIASGSHDYAMSGTWIATVSVTDAAGESASDSLNVSISAPHGKPEAGSLPGIEPPHGKPAPGTLPGKGRGPPA